MGIYETAKALKILSEKSNSVCKGIQRYGKAKKDGSDDAARDELSLTRQELESLKRYIKETDFDSLEIE